MRPKHNDWFQCKQFRVNQARAGMRVTTHACVFGAWVELPVCENERLLDIGTGTGLLSLMAAQRCAAHIDAVEIDAGAAQDARENFTISPWGARLQVHEMPVQQFAQQAGVRYAHILSNPPFFSASLRNDCARKSRARHDDDLDFRDLFAAVDALLTSTGRFHVLIPSEAASRLAQAASAAGFYLAKETGTRSLAHKPVTRLMQAWQRAPTAVTRDTLNLFGDYPEYSAPVRALLSPYYLHL